jgi:hypothetical protein
VEDRAASAAASPARAFFNSPPEVRNALSGEIEKLAVCSSPRQVLALLEVTICIPQHLQAISSTLFNALRHFHARQFACTLLR